MLCVCGAASQPTGNCKNATRSRFEKSTTILNHSTHPSLLTRVHMPVSHCSPSSNARRGFSSAFTIGSFESGFDPRAIIYARFDRSHLLCLALLLSIGRFVNHLSVSERDADQPVIVPDD